MNKVIPIVVAVVAVLGLLGWYFMGNRAVAPVQPSASTPAPQETTTVAPMTVPEEKTSILGSMKEAMGLGKRMACTYTDTTTGTATTIFVEGKKMKSATTMSGVTMYGIFDGDTQYSWSSNEKTGMKMDASCMNELQDFAKNMPSSSTPAPAQDFEAYQALQNVSCVPAETENFTLPTNVTFTDQCAMLRESMKAIEQMKDQIPSGMPMQL